MWSLALSLQNDIMAYLAAVLYMRMRMRMRPAIEKDKKSFREWQPRDECCEKTCETTGLSLEDSLLLRVATISENSKEKVYYEQTAEFLSVKSNFELSTMIVILLAATALAATTWIVLKIRSAREIDVMSFVLTNIMMKMGFLKILKHLGLTELMRPTVSKIVTRNNIEFTTASPTLTRILFDYVWKFDVRESDVFIATYPKAGTTWVQEIVWLICNNADTKEAKKTYLMRRSPFLEIMDVGDTRGMQTLEKWPSNSQRVIKTHQPFEILPQQASVEKKGKIVYVARNPKDLCVSFYHFHHMVPSLPRTGPWEEFLSKFMEGNVPWGDWFTHNLKYWEEHKKNPQQIYFVTYEDLKGNLFKEIKSLATFLGKVLSDEQIKTIVEHCTFENMSKNKSVNFENWEKDAVFDFSKAKFLRKGAVGDWKNYFTINQSKIFDKLFEERMKGSGLNLQFESSI